MNLGRRQHSVRRGASGQQFPTFPSNHTRTRGLQPQRDRRQRGPGRPTAEQLGPKDPARSVLAADCPEAAWVARPPPRALSPLAGPVESGSLETQRGWEGGAWGSAKLVLLIEGQGGPSCAAIGEQSLSFYWGCHRPDGAGLAGCRRGPRFPPGPARRPPNALYSPGSSARSRSGAQTTSSRARRPCPAAPACAQPPRAPATMAPPGASLAGSASPRRAQRRRCPGRAASSAAKRGAGTGRGRPGTESHWGGPGRPRGASPAPPRPAPSRPVPSRGRASGRGRLPAKPGGAGRSLTAPGGAARTSAATSRCAAPFPEQVLLSPVSGDGAPREPEPGGPARARSPPAPTRRRLAGGGN